MLLVPDNNEQTDLPAVTYVSQSRLSATFSAAADVAGYYAQDPETQQVDIGFNYSSQEGEKIIASQRRTFHVHVLGFSGDDMDQTIKASEIRTRADLYRQLREPVVEAITDIADMEVFERGTTDRLSMDLASLFKRDRSDERRITFKMKNGAAALTSPRLPELLKQIHIRSQQAYDRVAACFFERTGEGGFAETRDGRYRLLLPAVRLENVDRYLRENPRLSPKTGRYLNFLAARLGDMSEVDDPVMRDRFLAIKGLGYACVFSGVRSRERFEWKFGFDPVVFSKRDILQASRGTSKLFQRLSGQTFNFQRLEAVREDERNLYRYLLSREGRSIYSADPGLEI